MNDQTHIIICDDDADIRKLLHSLLTQNQFKVTCTSCADEFFEAIEKYPDIELAILDVMLPGKTGFDICRELRQVSKMPIIMLTAANETSDKVLGLEFGSDDYLSKPFEPRELLARIKAILRRTQDQSSFDGVDEKPPTYKFADWRLDTATRRLLSPDDIEIPLSSGVYDLLVAFVERPQRILSRDQLLDFTRNRTAEPFDRSIDIQVSRLRQKIEKDPKNPIFVKTIRSGGYTFTPSVKRL